MHTPEYEIDAARWSKHQEALLAEVCIRTPDDIELEHLRVLFPNRVTGLADS